MLKDILDILKSSDADDWAVNDTKKNGWEFYFIRHDLDQNRLVDTEHISVTVYKKSDDGKQMGSANQEIPPTASCEEIKKTVSDLVERAALVKNPVYSLRKPSEITPDENPSDVADISKDFIETLSDIPETKTEDVNCYEIFASEIDSRLITSTGIDVTQKYPQSFLEVVTNARKDGHEIELYRSYDSGTCDRDLLKSDITKTLRYGKDRLNTVPTPAVGTCPLLLSTADAMQVYRYFAQRVNAAMVYQKLSDWKLGEPFASGVTGDRITLSSRKFLPNSSKNHTFDPEGAAIRDEVLIEDDVVKTYCGDQMFSDYLGLKDTFMLTNYEVEPGESTEEELRNGRYLEVVEFSDFQVDTITGHIFGEIRLGYLHDKCTTTIVSGGSVSGTMNDCVKSMHLSKEMTQYDNARVPSVVVLDNVTVTGAK